MLALTRANVGLVLAVAAEVISELLGWLDKVVLG